MAHELPKAYDPRAIEARWAEYWVREKLFAVATPKAAAEGEGETHICQKRADVGHPPVFTLLLPPPNVTGRLHMGHMLNQTEMDIVIRWHRMRGFLTLWLPGTDHAGIATQMMVERQLASEGKSRTELGREAFIARVWQWREQYGGAILDQMRRLGASVDWQREYFTMDERLSGAVREAFVRLHEEGLIYRGKYIVNWCPRCITAISDLEVVHEESSGKLYDIKYPVIEATQPGAAVPHQFITVATTRPETMLGDTAVAVNPKDARYRHLHGKKVLLPLMEREIPIILDEVANPEFGTGAVKVTPAHDPNDFAAGLRHNLPQIDVMNEVGVMNENAGRYAGLDRYEARERILRDLNAQGLLAGVKDYLVPLGKCSRCKTVVEPRLSTQWFVAVNQKPNHGGPSLGEKAIEVVEKGEITFVPENYAKTYFEWMRNLHDWCISRQLWWGHRIPAWHCACGEIVVARETPTRCPKCGGALTQDPDVLDTWFSSGLLPMSALGWPDRTPDLDVFYPTSLLITGFDILFFWVARMNLLNCHFMPRHQQDAAIKQASGWGQRQDDSVPYREVYIHALVRDAERQKMSKTKGNVIDPIDIIEEYGTDAVRFTLASMAAPGTDIAFSESRTDGYRAFANKIWNAARFMFMNVDKALPAEQLAGRKFPMPLEDRWILSRLNRVARQMNEAFAAYRFHEAAQVIYNFFWGEFCDWYLEWIKPRLLDDKTEEARLRQTATIFMLSSVFETALRLLSPIMPFITEELWHALYLGEPPQKSIALARFPEGDEKYISDETETAMAIVQDLIVSVRNLRHELKVEARQSTPIELHCDAEVRRLVEENRTAVERLASVEGIAFTDASLAKAPGARSTARFDVRVVYEKKVNLELERRRLAEEQKRLVAEKERVEKQLSNEGFLTKAPPAVVAGARKRVEELGTLISKVRSALLDSLGTTAAKVQHYLPQFYLEGFLDPELKAKGQNLLWVYEPGKRPRMSATSKAAADVEFYSFEEAGEVKRTTEAVLSKVESYTAPVLKRLVSGKFDLSPDERGEFAGLIALTFCRTPFFLRSIDKLAVDFQKHLSKAMANVPGELERSLRILELQEQRPSDVTAEQLREFVLSERYTVTQKSKAWTLKIMFQMALDLMPLIEKMRWNWLISEEQFFLTSDHPIALFDPTPRFYSPGFMSSPEAEFTFPLSATTCLYCRWQETESVARISGASAREVNRRTIEWAQRYVFAPEKSDRIAEIVNEVVGHREPDSHTNP